MLNSQSKQTDAIEQKLIENTKINNENVSFDARCIKQLAVEFADAILSA